MQNHILIALSISIFLSLFALIKPKLGIVLTFIYLALLGEIRRIVGFYFGFPALDPLIIVTALPVILILLHPNGKIQEKIKLDFLILLFACLMAIQAFNTKQGGIIIGLLGLFYYLIPLVWFFIGRKFGNRKIVKTVLYLVIPISLIALSLGLYQSLFGYLGYELAWLDQVNYSSLSIGSSIRSISVFCSAAEYYQYLIIGMTVLISIGYFWVPLIFMPAIFLGGSRGPLIISVVSLILISLVKAKGLAAKIILSLFLTIVFVYSLFWVKDTTFSLRVNDAVYRQTSGILNPLDEDSTLPRHLTMIYQGFANSIKNPLGYGIASTANTTKLGGEGLNTELDITNMFTSLGIFGGLLYVLIVFYVLRSAYKLWRANRNWYSTVILLILILNLGSWLLGGHYAVSALIWFLIGSIANLGKEKSEIDHEIYSHKTSK